MKHVAKTFNIVDVWSLYTVTFNTKSGKQESRIYYDILQKVDENGNTLLIWTFWSQLGALYGDSIRQGNSKKENES